MFRSVLCFWPGRRRPAQLHHAAGPAAIEAYLEDPLAGRLIMSMKTYLAQRSFTRDPHLGRALTLEALVATFLRALLDAAWTSRAPASPSAARCASPGSSPTTPSARHACAPPSPPPACPR